MDSAGNAFSKAAYVANSATVCHYPGSVLAAEAEIIAWPDVVQASPTTCNTHIGHPCLKRG